MALQSWHSWLPSHLHRRFFCKWLLFCLLHRWCSWMNVTHSPPISHCWCFFHGCSLAVFAKMIALASFPDILRVPLFAALPVSHHVLRRSGEAERCCVRAPSPQGLRAGDSYPPRTDVSRSASDMITVPLRRHLALNHTTFPPPPFPGEHA